MKPKFVMKKSATTRSFEGKVAAITGAGSGIGRSLALALAQRKCHLALSDIDPVGLEETARQARFFRIEVTNTVVDVADRDVVQAWADDTVQTHGRVNLIFNNAGVALGSMVESMSYEDLEWLLNINLWGVIHGTKAFLPYLKRSGDGHVINLSSVFGLVAVPGQSAYNTAKFAVRGFTEALGQELDIEGAPVAALCVHPGGIKTNISASARLDTSVASLLADDSGDPRQSFEKLLRTTSESAAETILKAVQRRSRRVLVGSDAHLIDRLQRFFPTGYQKLLVGAVRLRGSQEQRQTGNRISR